MRQVKDFLLVFAGAALLAACGGGGGGGGGDTDGGGYGPLTVTISPAARPIVGLIASAELKDSSGAESFGSVGFVGSNVAPGTKFGLLQTSMRPGPASVVPNNQPAGTDDISAIDKEGVTIELVEAPYAAPGGDGDARFKFNMPSIDINDVIIVVNKEDGSIVPADRRLIVGMSNLQYTLAGTWGVVDNPSNAFLGAGVFVTGFRTPAVSLPVVGSANFTGETAGIIFGPDTNGYSAGAIQGDVAITANFAVGSVNGNMSNMTVEGPTGSPLPWNNVSFSANIVGGSSSFTGTTSTTSSVGGTFGLPSGSAGFIDGGFYGPNAEEVGAVWTMYNDNKSVMGVLMATQ